MKRENTIDNLIQLAEKTAQVQADRIEIVLEERSDEHFPAMSKALMETRSGLTRRKLDDAISKFAVGCSTLAVSSTVTTSFVTVAFPDSSTSILSSPLGPRVERTAFDSDTAAATFRTKAVCP